MTLPLPSLNLSFEKHSSSATTLDSRNTNDNSAKNSVVLNVFHPYVLPPPATPRPLLEIPIPQIPPCEPITDEPRRHTRTKSVTEVKDYESPLIDETEREFKDQILAFTTDLLLKDFDLLKNISERGSKILFHVDQLKMLIAILYLRKEDRPRFDDFIEIETENVIIHNCFCKDCYNPFYVKIKNIHVNKTVNFMTTPYAVNMMTVFKINLEYCLKG
jgi:hypothetical protein